jgi:hypothetical protein
LKRVILPMTRKDSPAPRGCNRARLRACAAAQGPCFAAAGVQASRPSNLPLTGDLPMTTRLATFALPLAAALALAACAEAEDTAYEVDATDEGGGELIVAEQQPDAVEVDMPDTPMTNVPEEDAEVPAE